MNLLSTVSPFPGLHALGHAGSMNPSGYEAKLSAQSCKAYALCVKRCPMEAIQLRPNGDAKNKKGKTAALKPELCIGCGVCAYSCPTGSLTLTPRPKTVEPPRDVADLKGRYSRELSESRAKNKDTGQKDTYCMGGDISSGEGIDAADQHERGA